MSQCTEEWERIEEWEKKINEERQPPEQVMDAIGAKPGMVIGELGAGRGRYTVHLARRVGNEGKILANDIDEDALSYLRERCRRDNIHNVETVFGEVKDPLLPEQALDMAVMVWVYHMLDQTIPLLKNLKRSLKPDATVAILDPAYSRTGERGSREPTTTERVIKEAAEAGYELVRVDSSLPKDDIWILRVKATR